MKDKNAWTSYTETDLAAVEELSKGYIDFMSTAKTERECVDLFVDMAEKRGYRDLRDVIAAGDSLTVGSKIYAVNMKKALLLLNVGEDLINNGMNILGAHIDSPRLDIKQNPLYESDDFAYLNTHYYGGVKKYQWVAIPLAIHGVFARKDGTVVKVNVGEDPADPVFFITDLLPHLAHEQMEKTATKIIEGENLDLTVGSTPLTGVEKNAVKANILKLLKEKYAIEEEDFLSAELEVVPAGRAREAGFDRSMILAYGHDDRSCAYTEAVAFLEVTAPTKTACALFVDKEEIGSIGATGMESHFFEDTVREVLGRMGIYSELNLTRVLRNSRMLSSDVSAAYDPLFQDRFERANAALLGHGLSINKYTGAGGKFHCNDANAEYLAVVRRIFDDNHVTFQTAELAKVDAGGGGTIAYILSLYDMQVVDSGVPVLSMHAPWEAVSKADLYEAKKGYVAFLLDA
ncbi:MAG: aminopeptidase [Mogibacterium sp.]|nr:aminopeptidase [Mogibacterium sp.]